MNYKLTVLSISIFFLGFFWAFPSWSQQGVKLIDARNTQDGLEFQKLMDQKPSEVQFGILVLENGDVYFSCNNKAWLGNILSSDSFGITSDIVSKEKYQCGSPPGDSTQMQRGFILNPVFRSDLLSHLEEVQTGAYTIKLGNTGKSYFNREVEGNLLFIENNRVLYYVKFINLDRSPFHILPMGLYTDTLIQTEPENENEKSFTFSKSVQITVPFPKSRANFKPSDFSPLYEALNLKDFQIEKIEIRAYSSVEGKESFNDTLMKRRAEAMLSEIKKSQPGILRINILTAENWLEFFEKIKGTEFKNWSDLSKEDIKKRLLDKIASEKLEGILSDERKAVVSVYLSKKTRFQELSGAQILDQFHSALGNKNLHNALFLEQEILARIRDNKLPETYLNQLEIPETSDFIPLLNEKLIFPLLYNQQSEKEALAKFKELKKLDPKNARVNYNIQALRLSLWEKENDNTGTETLLEDIENLEKLGIAQSLIKRMLINDYILRTADEMVKGDYSSKNQSLKFISDTYTHLKLNDHEIFSLAKYFSFYGRMDWAKILVSSRIDKLDIDEDLLFYFLNLEFYDPSQFRNEIFQKGVLNAININKSRFCKFFTPADQNGASIQLLEYWQLKKIYCSSCLNSDK